MKLLLLFFFSIIISDKLPGSHQDLSMFPNTFIQVDFPTSTEKSLPLLTEIPILYLVCTASLVTHSALVILPGTKCLSS